MDTQKFFNLAKNILFPKEQITKPMYIIWLVALYVTVGQFAAGIYLPSLPQIARDFGGHEGFANWTLTAYFLTYGGSQFFYGPFSDKHGRYKAMLLGIIIYIFGSLIAVISSSLIMLIISCLIQGVGIGAAGVMCRAVPRDLFSGKKLLKINSLLQIIFVITPLIAPILGGLIHEILGWKYNFKFLFLYSLLISMILIPRFPETSPNILSDIINSENQNNNIIGIVDEENSIKNIDNESNTSDIDEILSKNEEKITRYKYFHKVRKYFSVLDFIENYKIILKNREFLICSSCASAAYLMISAYEIGCAYIFQNQFGFSPSQFGWIIVIPCSVYVLGSYLTNIAIKYMTIRQVMIVGTYIIFCSSFFMLLASFTYNSVLSLMIPISFITLGTGLLIPCSISRAMEPFDGRAGTSGAALGGIQYIGASSGIFLFSLLPINSPIGLSIFVFILAMICLGLATR